MKWLVRLYPKAWRERYESEFRALLDDTGGGWRNHLDVLGGAVRMQFLHGGALAICAATATAGALAAWLVAASAAPRFVSDAVLNLGLDQPAAVLQQAFSRTELSRIIGDLNLYPSETSMERAVELMRRNITVTSEPDSQLVRLRFAHPDAASARRATTLLMSRIADAQAADGNGRAFQVVQAAALPRQGVSPRTAPIVVAGTAAGLLAGIIATVVRNRPIRWARYVAAFGLAGAAAGLALALLLPSNYRSSALLKVNREALPSVTQALSRLPVTARIMESTSDYALVCIEAQHKGRFHAQNVVARATADLLKSAPPRPSAATPAPDRIAAAPVAIIEPASLSQFRARPRQPLASLLAGLALGLAAGAASAHRRLYHRSCPTS